MPLRQVRVLTKGQAARVSCVTGACFGAGCRRVGVHSGCKALPGVSGARRGGAQAEGGFQAGIAVLDDSLRLKARRHIGHNPAGGAMVLALIAAIASICATGYMMETPAYRDARWLEEVHEVLANGTLALIFLHVAGVLLASFEHKENLVAAIFTGRKRA